MLSAEMEKPSRAATAAAVYESRPPLRRTTALDATRCRAPDVLVHLQLHTHRQAIGNHPLRQHFRIELAVHRRKQHCIDLIDQLLAPDELARELVVGAVR